MTAVVICYLIYAPKLFQLAKTRHYVTPSDFVQDRLAESVQLARAQKALALELRSALTGMHWAQAEGDADNRRDVLRQVLARFAPGTTGRDLDDARAMLAATR